MTIKLDKTLDDASDVFPPEHGAHYFQKGFYFDQNGDLVTHPELFDEKAAAKLKRLEALALANEKMREIRRKTLEEAGVDPSEIKDEEEEEETKTDAKVDIKAWLRGKTKVIFPLVQKAIQEQHGFNATSKKQAVEFLVAEIGLVAPEDVNIL